MIEALGIRVERGGAAILDDVSLRLEPGEMLGLIGPNGAGKSTLLKVLCGLEQPARGTVRLDGRRLGEIDRRVLARSVGYLPQRPELHWRLTVADVVALGRLPRGDDGEAAVIGAMAACRIGEFAARDATGLSGGEHMRMMLARVLAGEPRYLLVDEATAALDPYHQLLVIELLRDAAAKGAGVVAVLHDLGLAARFCDRLQLLRTGTTVAVGPPDAVLAPQTLREVYGVNAIVQTIAGERMVQILDRVDG